MSPMEVPHAAQDVRTAPASAFLILNSQVYPLNHDNIKIGRKLDNHIVIDSSSVSRVHAQVRIVNGQYVILDLNSTGGTYVNGQPVNKSVLYSGDTVAIADVEMKFVQDAPRILSKALDRTGPLQMPEDESED